jgi:hypothetical protein
VGHAGGERVLEVFEIKLKDAIQKLPFDKILTLKNVHTIVNEADGYQPHIIAPENGYRRLIEEGLALLREPANHAVSQVRTDTAGAVYAWGIATFATCCSADAQQACPYCPSCPY